MYAAKVQIETGHYSPGRDPFKNERRYFGSVWQQLRVIEDFWVISM